MTAMMRMMRAIPRSSYLHGSPPRKMKKSGRNAQKSYNFCHTGIMIKSVAMIVVPNCSILHLATAFEVFGTDRSDRGNGLSAFDFRVCTPEPGDVPLKSGLSMNVASGWKPLRMRTWW